MFSFQTGIIKIEKVRVHVLRATLTDGTVIEADQILFATGRAIENAGARFGKGGRGTQG